jgi:hypothetical protein
MQRFPACVHIWARQDDSQQVVAVDQAVAPGHIEQHKIIREVILAFALAGKSANH